MNWVLQEVEVNTDFARNSYRTMDHTFTRITLKIVASGAVQSTCC